MSDLRCEVKSADALGEGPLWDPRSGELIWVDILGARLHRLHLASGEHREERRDPAVTALGLHAEGGYVATLWDRFARLDADFAIVESHPVQEPQYPENRFNDGKVDAQGRFWAGSMHADLGPKTGALYKMDAGVITQMDDQYTVTNGPTFSPDGRTLYHTSTMDYVVYAFDLDEVGAISNKRVFIQFPHSEGQPDGMTVDETGDVWIAHFGGGRVTRFSAAGVKKDYVDIPAHQVTSCTFGGADLDRMYVTTAAVGRDAQDDPDAGALFSFDPGVKGLPPAYYKP